jgi:2-C-methyl-D-erythritol 4-phosphate cytidylyltransferase
MSTVGSVAALVLAAGRGERLGHSLPKAFVPVGGKTMIEHSIHALSQAGSIDWILPVLAASDLDRWQGLDLESIAGVGPPVSGGAERQHSMGRGLAALPDEIEFVAVHDAARCLVRAEDIDAVVQVARASGAAILAERVRDTIKRVVDRRIVETPGREECWAALTPQVFRRDWLVEALANAEKNDRLATDDAQLVEWLGHPVTIVESRSPNPKITRPEDLVLAEALLAAREEK